MGKLRSLTTTLRKHEPVQRRVVPSASDQRLAGRALQARRLKLWTANPYCRGCGQLTVYPHGFELDHIVRLDEGGADTEAAVQVLCVWFDELGQKHGCHAAKTAEEVREGARKSKYE